MFNKKQYPLIVLKNVRDLYQVIRTIADENRDVVAVSTNNEFEIHLKDTVEQSNFSFSISNPKYEKGKMEFTLTYNPRNEQSLSEVTIGANSEAAIERLNGWIKLIREYDQISLTPDETILNEYEREFYDDFEIVDEDANTHSFDLNKQVILHNFLTYTIRTLEGKKEEGNTVLIQQATDLRDNLPKFTKKTTIQKLSRLLATIRQKSLPLLKEVLDVAKKELYKKITTGGFKMIGEFIETLI